MHPCDFVQVGLSGHDYAQALRCTVFKGDIMQMYVCVFLHDLKQCHRPTIITAVSHTNLVLNNSYGSPLQRYGDEYLDKRCQVSVLQAETSNEANAHFSQQIQKNKTTTKFFLLDETAITVIECKNICTVTCVHFHF